MKKILIIGAGGFGKELYGYISQDIQNDILKDIEIKGFLDISEKSFQKLNIETSFLGSEDTYEIEEEDYFLIAIGVTSIRKNVYENMLKRGAKFYTYIHSTAIIDSSATIGCGSIICPFSIVNSQSKIGKNCALNIYSSVGHDSSVGSHSILSPYASLNGDVQTGDNLFMGTRSTILLGSILGLNCIVSAHSVVKGKIGDNYMFKDKVSQIKIKNRLI